MSAVSFLFFLPTFLSPLSLVLLWIHNSILRVEAERIKVAMQNLRSGNESEPFQPEYFELRIKLNVLKKEIIPASVITGIFLAFFTPLVNWIVILYLAIVALFSSTAFASIRKAYSSTFFN